MELVFTLRCDVDNVSVQRAKPKNLANVLLSTKIEKEKAKGAIDDKLIRLAFGTLGVEKMDDGPSVPTFGYRSINIGDELEPHTVKMLGFEFVTTPKLATIKPVKGERAIYLALTIPFIVDADKDGLIRQLMQECKTDRSIELEIAPAQGELFNRDGVAAANGKHDAEDEKPAGGKAKRKAKTSVVNTKRNFGHDAPKVVS